MTLFRRIATPLGESTAFGDADGRLKKLWIGSCPLPVDAQPDDGKLEEVERQLQQYFARERRDFDLEMAPEGTGFQHQVWAMLMQIPMGETRTYGQLAAMLGDPGKARAVGRANATNPIWLIVPCHRVIGESGSLTGYAGGIEVKRWLLEFEGAWSPSLFEP